MSSQKLGIRINIPEAQSSSRTSWRQWKMILDHMRCSSNKDHQHLKWRQQKSWISYPDCQDAQDKQLTQYLLIPKSKWKMLQNYWKFQNRNVQTFWNSSTTTQMAKIMVQYRRPSRSSWAKSVCHPLARLLCERQFETILKKYGWEKVSTWECLFVHRKKGYSYLCMWMT